MDGWRCLVADIEWARANIPCEPKHREYFAAARHAIALSASNKPISNWFVQRQLDDSALIGCDGELIASKHFNETSSAFATHGGEPAFAFHIFDLFNQPQEPFGKRLLNLQGRQLPNLGDNIELHCHPHQEILDANHLTEYLEESLPADAEGAITRDPSGLYKFGRATPRQQWMLKIKPFVDAEAVVVGVEELMYNDNDPEVSQLGLQRRSSRKDGKVPSGKLGSLVCKHIKFDGDVYYPEIGVRKPCVESFGPAFRIGTGFTDADRHLFWAQRNDLLGHIVKYKSMQKGSVDLPRHPVFKGFRAEDLSS